MKENYIDTTDIVILKRHKAKEAYEAYKDRLSMEPCPIKLTEDELEQLKKEKLEE